MANEKLIHLDLFSGIGGFAFAADQVFGKENIEHVFCEIEPFAQEVLKKHWPDAEIYKDIRLLTSDAYNREQPQLRERGASRRKSASGARNGSRVGTGARNLSGDKAEGIRRRADSTFLLTGGFPCQPFSLAGRRRGAADDRFLWPEMCRVIGEFQPEWVIAENVRGLLTQGGGVVFERVCTDLEALGYEVQPIVIPAVAVGAPHRRDRVWFVAHRFSTRPQGSKLGERKGYAGQRYGVRQNKASSTSLRRAADTSRGERQQRDQAQAERPGGHAREFSRSGNWREHWLEVATRLCRVDDGVPRRLDRNPRLKALGNAIVPQVAEEIMRAIAAT